MNRALALRCALAALTLCAGPAAALETAALETTARTAAAHEPAGDLAAADASLLHEGRQLYLGQRATAQPALLAGVALPPAAAACSQCHGAEGEGRREAGVVAPSIQWQALQQPSARQPGYAGTTTVLQAIVAGTGRSAQPLLAPMPQFALSAREQQALLAYLRVLGTEAEPVPGVGPAQVRVATVLPLSGPQAAVGQRVRDSLAQHFAATNARGGIFGRRIALQVVDGGPQAADTARALQTLLGDHAQPPFAVVASLLQDADEALHRTVAANDLPLVASLGLPLADSPLPQLTYLLPSVAGQVQQLASELARHCGSQRPLLVLHPPGPAWAQALKPRAADGQRPWQALAVANAAELDAALATHPAPLVVAALGPPLMARLRAASGPQCLGTLAAVSGQALPGPPNAPAELLALPMPALSPGSTGPGGLWAVLAEASARVLEEALARSGRLLNRSRFQQALQGLHRFEPTPGLGLALTFTPSRHHGFDVTTLWTEDHHAEPAH